jgi:hypothetical protein
MIKNISKNILLKYTILPNDYNIIMINHLISKSDAHLICLFKDYLLYDDPSEFLKCLYKKFEIKSRLKHLTKYYENSSKLFPNYSPLKEGNYIYLNIQRKQKIIDLIEGMKLQNKLKNDKSKNENLIIFNNEIYNSILAENINDRSKIKHLFGSYIFNSEKRNDTIKSIVDFTNILTGTIEQNKKDNKNNNVNSINKTRTTSANSNINGKNVKEKTNFIVLKNKKLNLNYSKLIKHNINNTNKLKIQKNFNIKKANVSLPKEKKNYKLNDKNISILLKKIPHPQNKKTKNNKIKKQNQNENKKKFNISLYIKKFKPSYKFPIKSNFNGNDINKKTSKVNNKTIELNKIKEILNKSIRKRNIITTNDFNTINVSTISNKTLLFTETERKKNSTPKRIIKTNRNLNNYEINNSFHQLKRTSQSEKTKRKKKCINIIC